MFNHTVKVENTVAMMQLTRQALSGLDIVPRVFAWSETGEPSGTGWILEEYMPGVDIETEFSTDVPREAQRFVLSQMAIILKAVQDFELPPKASGFGGLVFDDSGVVTSGPFAVEPYNGPYPDMESMYKGMLQAQLVEADRSRVAQGWKEDGLRDRLDAFAERGLEDILTRSLPEHVRPNLIIGDVGMFPLDPPVPSTANQSSDACDSPRESSFRSLHLQSHCTCRLRLQSHWSSSARILFLVLFSQLSRRLC